MYKIYADGTLIFDNTIDDYKIGKGEITLETNKSSAFVFSLYPDHPHYNSFIRLATIITVYKRDKIVFRGRILNDVTDHWNNKVFTCEGELSFLNDSIVRPFTFSGSPSVFLKQFIEAHNAQVDETKRFKIGNVTVTDSNGLIARNSTLYESTLSSLTSRTTGSDLGGYLAITHGDDGRDPIPTIHWLKDFDRVSSQTIEFGVNLKNYTRTIKADSIATAIIPLGADIESTNGGENTKLTISSVNGGVDYIYSPDAVAVYGWIFKTVEFSDITVASNLKKRAEEYLKTIVLHTTTIELNAIDLNLLNPEIESIGVNEYIRAVSTPHHFDETFLCTKQTINILKPENDTYILGYTYSSFTRSSNNLKSNIVSVSNGLSENNQKVIAIINENNSSQTVINKALTLALSDLTLTSDQNAMSVISENLSSYPDIFDSLKPIEFNIDNDPTRHIGFTVQGVEAIFEALGSTPEDFGMILYSTDAEGNKTSYGLKYDEFIALLAHEIQKLKARVIKLEGGG